MSEHGWFLDHERYWVATSEADAYPLRQGDLIRDLVVDGQRWPAAQIVHPTCELGKPSVGRVQVARVRSLDDIRDAAGRRLVTLGYRDIRGKHVVAVAHTFFLAPWPNHDKPAFVDFRELATVERNAISQEARAAAMTHDCRVTWIRRWIYFRLRLIMTFTRVREMEAKRIANDPRFEGPRPEWAPLVV